jgi:peptidyl-prolyl cis-trans isomerase D
MLKTLRTKTRKVMLGTLILVIPSFVFFYGWGSLSSQRGGAGSDIRFARFSPAGAYWFGVEKWRRWVDLSAFDVSMGQSALISFGMQLLGPEMMQGLLREFGKENLFPARDSVVQGINNLTLRHYADQRSIRVPDGDLKQIMASRLRGVPRTARERVLRSQGLTPESFALQTRLERQANLASQVFAVQARASLFDLWRLFQMRNQELKMDYVLFQRSDFEGKVEITDEALEDYFGKEQEKFRVGEQRQYQYAYLRKDSLRGDVKVTDEQIQKTYEENKEKYRKGREAQVRHILVPLETDAAMSRDQIEALTSETLRKAQTIKAALEGGEDFATLADKESGDPANTTEEGEKLGGLLPEWVSVENAWAYSLPFVEAALALNPGQVSKPVFVDSLKFKGHSVIKCENVKEERIPPLEEILDEVRTLCEQKALDARFGEKREELDGKVRGYADLKTMAQELQMSDGVSSWALTNSSFISLDLGYINPEDTEYISEMRVGETSLVLSSVDTLYVLKLIKQKESHIPPLEEIRDKVEEAFRKQKGSDMMKAAADDFLAKAATVEAMRASAEAAGIEVRTTDYFTRAEMPVDLQSAPLIGFEKDTLFAKAGEIGISPAGQSKNDVSAYVVWHIAELRDADQEAFEKEMPEIERSVLGARQKMLMDEWLWDQRNYVMKIKMNEDLLGSGEAE